MIKNGVLVTWKACVEDFDRFENESGSDLGQGSVFRVEDLIVTEPNLKRTVTQFWILLKIKIHFKITLKINYLVNYLKRRSKPFYIFINKKLVIKENKLQTKTDLVIDYTESINSIEERLTSGMMIRHAKNLKNKTFNGIQCLLWIIKIVNSVR